LIPNFSASSPTVIGANPLIASSARRVRDIFAELEKLTKLMAKLRKGAIIRVG
jgi:hypothetical protein